jgi:hypothetical protein
MANRRFAGTTIKIDSVTVAKITSWGEDNSTAETDVTGAEDIVAGTEILQTKMEPTAISSTVNFAGIEVIGDTGQSDVEDAFGEGTQVVITRLYNDGSGYDYTGFLTSYNRTGSIGDAVYKFTSTFRINSKVAVV